MFYNFSLKIYHCVGKPDPPNQAFFIQQVIWYIVLVYFGGIFEFFGKILPYCQNNAGGGVNPVWQKFGFPYMD